MVEVMREVKIPHLYIVHLFFLRIDGVVEFLRILRVHARKHSTMWCYTHAGQDSAVALHCRCWSIDAAHWIASPQDGAGSTCVHWLFLYFRLISYVTATELCFASKALLNDQ